jgi:hypothetical protein
LTYFAKHLRVDPNEQKLGGVTQAAEFELDVQPQWNEGRLALVVTWQGAPQAGVKVTATDGEGSSSEYTSDDQGRIELRGRPVAVVAHWVDSADQGALNGDEYRGAHYYATCTWQTLNDPSQAAGVDATRSAHLASAGRSERDRAAIRPHRPSAELDADAQPSPAPLPEPLASFGAAIVAKSLYVYGGHTGQEHEHTRDNVAGGFYSRLLDGSSGWRRLPSQGPRQGLALVGHGTSVVLIGGMAARNRPDEAADLHSTSSVARFDTQTQSWSVLPDLPQARSSHDAAIVGSRLYVVGGWTLSGSGEGQWLRDALVLDLSRADAAWQTIAAPPFMKRALACAEWQGKLVVLGGMDPEHTIDRSVWVYDPQLDRWTAGPEFPGEGMNGFGMAACNIDSVLFASGSDGNLYRLAPDGQSWMSVGQLDQPRFFHRLVGPVGSAVWAVGGAAHGVGHLDGIELLGSDKAIR